VGRDVVGVAKVMEDVVARVREAVAPVVGGHV
jgi:hypothetical protein